MLEFFIEQLTSFLPVSPPITSWDQLKQELMTSSVNTRLPNYVEMALVKISLSSDNKRFEYHLQRCWLVEQIHKQFQSGAPYYNRHQKFEILSVAFEYCIRFFEIWQSLDTSLREIIQRKAREVVAFFDEQKEHRPIHNHHVLERANDLLRLCIEF